MDDFNEAMFKTKIDNMFVKLLTAVMKGDLTEVDHFISDDVYHKYEDIINNLNSNNERQMYDELNVKKTTILSRQVLEDKEVIKVEIVSRYMDYVIFKDNGNLVRGDDSKRKEVIYNLTLEKKKETKEDKLVKKCPGCGASISVNTSGKCEYCGTIFNLEDYDYVIVEID